MKQNNFTLSKKLRGNFILLRYLFLLPLVPEVLKFFKN